MIIVSRGRIPFLFGLLLVASISACQREPESPRPGAKEFRSVGKLPAEFYRAWRFQASSGGIDGQGNRNYHIERIVLQDANKLEEHRKGGSVTSVPFIPGRGKSIFSSEDVWKILRKGSAMPEVISLGPSNYLTISEDVYDGFSYTFKPE